VRQIVQAHAYWRLKGLMVDLVILNEDDSVYRQALHDQILNLVAANSATVAGQTWRNFSAPRGPVFTGRQILLEAAARIVLHDDKGTLLEQLSRRLRPNRCRRSCAFARGRK
jgi:cyclic beta-1,2-glucan synthetase